MCNMSKILSSSTKFKRGDFQLSYSNTARHRFKIRGAEVGIDGKQNHFVGGQVFLGGEAGRQAAITGAMKSAWQQK